MIMIIVFIGIHYQQLKYNLCTAEWVKPVPIIFAKFSDGGGRFWTAAELS